MNDVWMPVIWAVMAIVVWTFFLAGGILLTDPHMWRREERKAEEPETYLPGEYFEIYQDAIGDLEEEWLERLLRP